MSSHRSTVAVALAFAALAASADLRAQVGSEPQPASVRRPFRGLFGGTPDPRSPHSLVLTGSLFAAYDDNVLEALSSRRVHRPWLQQSGQYQGGAAGLAYAFDRSGERVSFQGHAGGQLRYYRRGDDSNVLPFTQADVAIRARLTRSLSLNARQSVGYSSNYNFSLAPAVEGPQDTELEPAFGGEPSGADPGQLDDPDLDLFGLRTVRSASSLGLSQRLGRNTVISGAYHFRALNVVAEEEDVDVRFRDYSSQSGSFRFKHTRSLTRSAQLELGYGIRVSDQRSRTGEPAVMHNIIAGVNYSRALSFSRRTSFSFGSGSAIAVSDRVDVADSDVRRRLRLIGHAALVHELARTWTAQVGYSRGFLTREGFEDLYFSDAVAAGFNGLISRRLSLSAAAQWSTSSVEQRRNAGNRGLSASSQVTYGLARNLGLFARYVYYRYRYDEDAVLDPRFPRQLDRQGIRVGLSTSIPLIP